MIVQADFPLIFTVFSFVLRVNSENNPTDCVQHGDISDLTYICTNLTSNNIGEYMFHISFVIDPYSNPEWGSNNVTVTVQCKA